MHMKCPRSETNSDRLMYILVSRYHFFQVFYFIDYLTAFMIWMTQFTINFCCCQIAKIPVCVEVVFLYFKLQSGIH